MPATLKDLQDELKKAESIEKNLEDFSEVIRSVYDQAPLTVSKAILELKKSDFAQMAKLVDNVSNISVNLEEKDFVLSEDDIFNLFKCMNDISSTALAGAYLAVLINS